MSMLKVKFTPGYISSWIFSSRSVLFVKKKQEEVSVLHLISEWYKLATATVFCVAILYDVTKYNKYMDYI